MDHLRHFLESSLFGLTVMNSLICNTTILACILFLSQSCTQIFAPNEVMIDTLLSEQKVIEILTKQEWLNYKYFDPYTLTLPSQGTYSSGTNQILQLNANGRFSEKTNSLFPILKLQGKWRFIKAIQFDKIELQKEERYKRIVQGKLILLDSITNSQYSIVNIDTVRGGFSIAIVSDREFFSIHPSIHGPISWYYKVK